MRLQARIAFATATALLSVFASGLAGAECSLEGVSQASLNGEHPEWGEWKYTFTFTWDTGSVYSVSHIDLLLDMSGNCACSEFSDALHWDNPVGSSGGTEPDCTVPYTAYLECQGDPSIPDIESPLLKFEPYEAEGCEPGPTGSAVFILYSDFSPGDIAADNLFLVDKHGQLACRGRISGDFPALPCNPTPTWQTSWGQLKACYEH